MSFIPMHQGECTQGQPLRADNSALRCTDNPVPSHIERYAARYLCAMHQNSPAASFKNWLYPKAGAQDPIAAELGQINELGEDKTNYSAQT
jgi:hypothetical protein